MKCETARVWIDALIDGELPEKHEIEVKAHVASCACCARHEEAARKISRLASDFSAECPSNLRGLAWETMRREATGSNWIESLKEKLMYRFGFKIGAAATVLALSAVALFSLAPRNAEASWPQVETALRNIRNVKVTIKWTDGARGGSKVIWTDNQRVRMDYADGLVMMYRDGKTYEWGSDSSEIGAGFHLGPIDAGDFAVDKLIRTQAGRVTPVNDGNVLWNGRQLNRLSVETPANSYSRAKRYEILVDPATSLPVRFVEYDRDGEARNYVSEMLFEFNVAMPNELFTAPPNARTVDSPRHGPPDGEIIG